MQGFNNQPPPEKPSRYWCCTMNSSSACNGFFGGYLPRLFSSWAFGWGRASAGVFGFIAISSIEFTAQAQLNAQQRADREHGAQSQPPRERPHSPSDPPPPPVAVPESPATNPSAPISDPTPSSANVPPATSALSEPAASPEPQSPVEAAAPSPVAPVVVPARPAPVPPAKAGVAAPTPFAASRSTTTQDLHQKAQALPKPDERAEMSWAVTSVRLGVTSVSLRAGRASFLQSAVDDCKSQPSTGSWITPDPQSQSCDLNFTESLKTLGLSAHLGGDYYFFRIDANHSWNSAAKLYGLGLYPLNFGWYFPRYGLFPYITSGFAVDVVSSRRINETGVLARPRLGVGGKYRHSGWLGASLDIGFASGAVGALVAQGSDSEELRQRGGTGTAVDVTLGVEWF